MRRGFSYTAPLHKRGERGRTIRAWLSVSEASRMKNKQNLSSLVLHYASQPPYPSLSYATVRDYCDGVDHFPWLATLNDLKDAERPWAVKAVLNCLPPGTR